MEIDQWRKKLLTLFLPGGGRFTPALHFMVPRALNSCGRGLKPFDFSYKAVRSTLARKKNSRVTIFFQVHISWTSSVTRSSRQVPVNLTFLWIIEQINLIFILYKIKYVLFNTYKYFKSTKVRLLQEILPQRSWMLGSRFSCGPSQRSEPKHFSSFVQEFNVVVFKTIDCFISLCCFIVYLKQFRALKVYI